MGSIWLRARYELRAKWPALVSVALIGGLAAGVVIAAATGARRSASAYPRFLRAQDAYHALTGGGGSRNFAERFEAVKRLPEVADAVEVIVLGPNIVVPARRDRPERILGILDAIAAADPSGRILYEVHRAKILDGRLPDPSAVREAFVPFSVAERHDIRVGDTLSIRVGGLESRDLYPVEVEVVGIGAAPWDFEGVGQISFFTVYLTPAFLDEHRHRLPAPNPDMWSLLVKLRDGPAHAAAFKQKVETEPAYDFDVPFIEPTILKGVQKTMQLHASALWLVAALVGVAGIAVLGQTIARQIAIDSTDYPTLRGLGMSGRQLAAIGLVRVAMITLIAVPAGVVVSFLLSPLTPIGVARIAEPDPGFAFDAMVAGAGALATLGAIALVSIWPAYRAARLASKAGVPAHEHARGSRLVSTVARSGSPSAVAGLRMALERGRGRTAVPVRSTILAVAIAIAAVTATVTVGRSLAHLIDTPSLAGFTYDAIVPNEGGMSAEEMVARLNRFGFVEGTTHGTGLNISIEGTDSFLVSFRDGDPVGFTTIAGRAPTDAIQDGLPEIAVGPATFRRLGAALGELITFSYPGEENDRSAGRPEQRARVVGVAAIPTLPWAAIEPGEGAVMTLASVRHFLPEEGGCCFVRFQAGTNLEDARARLEEAGMLTFLRTRRADLVTLERITGLPAVLSLIFGVIAAAALVHVLVTGIRRRRRELAVLKTLGFVNRQIRGTVAWQASAIAALCVVVGVPIGVVLGRWGWNVVAGQFGVRAVPVVPLVLATAGLPVAVLVANLIAVLPARAAARTKPAVVLRSE